MDWRPIDELEEPTGTGAVYIQVRSVTTWRWLPYKPDGQRQMKRRGRWQRAASYMGFENAVLPEEADWQPAEKS